jgi:hypothetical protein
MSVDAPSKGRRTYSNQGSDDLTKSPPDGQECQEVLLVSRNEFQEHGSVNGQVSTSTNTDKGNHDTLDISFDRWSGRGLTKETKLGMAPARIPKIPERRRVEFHAIRRLFPLAES